MDRACAAVVSCAGPGIPPATVVPVRASRTGHPILLPRPGTALDRHLDANPTLVTITVPADAPFSALRLTGMTKPRRTVGMLALDRGPDPDPGPATPAAYPMVLQALEFTGSNPAPVALTQYEAAAPDPFRREATAALDHLERRHMADLVGCVRAHGITAAEYVVPRRLDRFGLELLVLSPSGLASVRLAFPNGPVTTIAEVPVSIRASLTCQCALPPLNDHVQGPDGQSELP
jgi:hypothetical protein